MPAGNVGNLPLVAVSTLSEEPATQFAQDPGKCQQTGIAHVTYAVWLANFVQCSHGVQLHKASRQVRTQVLFVCMFAL